jgi:hypothetical protein
VVGNEGSLRSGMDMKQSGVRHRRLVQIRERAGENERGNWGGSARCHVEEGKREREGPGHGSWQCGAKDTAGNGPWPSGMGDGAVAQQGRAVGRGRRGAARQTCGVGWHQGPMAPTGVREREKSGAVRRLGADRRARATPCWGTV